MMKLDEENGADTRLEDDQVMEVMNVAKDDLQIRGFGEDKMYMPDP